MKRIFFSAVILLSTLVLYAQEDIDFNKHELRVSLGPSLVAEIWIQDGIRYHNISVAYFYRPVKHFWVGANFINFLGDKINYNWREYNIDGSFSDFSKSKMKYCAVIAPEIRFSFVNRESVILYGALSGGIALEDGYDNRWTKYPEILPYIQLTYFGFSCTFGQKKNIFLGGELGLGFKGLISMHGGYRF